MTNHCRFRSLVLLNRTVGAGDRVLGIGEHREAKCTKWFETLPRARGGVAADGGNLRAERMEAIEVGIELEEIVHAGVTGAADIEREHNWAVLQQVLEHLRPIKAIGERESRRGASE